MEWIKDEKRNLARAKSVVEGLGNAIKSLAGGSEDVTAAGKEVVEAQKTKLSKADLMKTSDRRKAFKLGTNFRPVKNDIGKPQFREKLMKGVKKYAGPLSSILSKVAPIFLIGEVLFGNQQSTK